MRPRRTVAEEAAKRVEHAANAGDAHPRPQSHRCSSRSITASLSPALSPPIVTPHAGDAAALAAVGGLCRCWFDSNGVRRDREDSTREFNQAVRDGTRWRPLAGVR